MSKTLVKIIDIDEVQGELTLIYQHCRLHGHKIEEGLFRIRDHLIGDGIKLLMHQHNIPYIKKDHFYFITIDEPVKLPAGHAYLL